MSIQGGAMQLWHSNSQIDGGHDKTMVHEGNKIKGLKPKRTPSLKIL